MKHNMGSVDQVVRIIAGLIILSLIFILEGNARWWGLIGLAPIATAVFRWCPGYLPFGISTEAKPAEKQAGPGA